MVLNISWMKKVPYSLASSLSILNKLRVKTQKKKAQLKYKFINFLTYNRLRLRLTDLNSVRQGVYV